MAANRFRVLSFDGGGVRGVIPAVWLTVLEERLGSPLAEHFDLLAGTSTGAILACASSAGIPAAEILRDYEQLGREVFPACGARLWNRFLRTFTQGLSAPKYDDAGLERALRGRFGARVFGELRVPTLVTAYDVSTRAAVVFKTAGRTRRGDPWRWDAVPVWEIVKASASAPVYLPAHLLGGAPLVDGGVVANNPAACALAEAVRMNRERPEGERAAYDDFVVVSLGTGSSARSIPAAEAREWGGLQWVLPLIDVLFDGAADAVDYIVDKLAPSGRYVRFQMDLDPECDAMDDADPANLARLRDGARAWLESEQGRARLDAALALF